MRKNSKPPEERRRELVSVASRLFQEKGYEAVSVRDILDAVHGAPGIPKDSCCYLMEYLLEYISG